jgi:tetratricopeptide (TPR) repeat protein
MKLARSKLALSSLFCILTASMLFGGSLIDTVEDLYHNGKHEDALKLLEENYDSSNPDLGIVWRMSREIYEIGDKISSKDKDGKIETFTRGMEVVKPFLDTSSGSNEDRARVIFWYATNYGSRGKVIGIRESLGNIPEMMELADKSIALDPSHGSAYFLVAKIDEAVPGLFHGTLTTAGDKLRMGVNFNKAIQYDPNMTHLVEGAIGFYDRNWSADKKAKNYDEAGKDDGSPSGISDREYALKLLKQATSLYKSLEDPSVRDKVKYKEALKYIDKLD